MHVVASLVVIGVADCLPAMVTLVLVFALVDFILYVRHLREHLILRLVETQCDVLEKLNVQEDHDLIDFLHELEHFLIQCPLSRVIVVLSLFKLALIAHESLMIFPAFAKRERPRSHILLLLLRFFCIELAQLDFVVLILLLVSVAFLCQVLKHLKLHIYLLGLVSQIRQNLLVFLDHAHICSHVCLHSLKQLLVTQCIILIQFVECLSHFLTLHHEDFILREDCVDVSELCFHFLDLRSHELLALLDLLIWHNVVALYHF